MQRSLPVPQTRPPRRYRKRKLLAFTTLGLAGLLAGLLSGCSGGNSNPVNTAAVPSARSYAAVAGNWKFTTGATAGLSTLSGALAVDGTAVRGMLHPLTATCVASADAFAVSGSIDASGLLSISSTKFAGGGLTLSGSLAPDQHSLIDPVISVSNGSCANPSAKSAARVALAPTAQQFQPLMGTYNGTFTDASGAVLPVSATLSQPTAPDPNGLYHLTGSATFADNSCLNTPVITDSTITGDTIQTTYTDTVTGNTVAGSGTFSADAQTITISHWILTGCGNDTGTGVLSRTVI